MSAASTRVLMLCSGTNVIDLCSTDLDDVAGVLAKYDKRLDVKALVKAANEGCLAARADIRYRYAECVSLGVANCIDFSRWDDQAWTGLMATVLHSQLIGAQVMVSREANVIREVDMAEKRANADAIASALIADEEEERERRAAKAEKRKQKKQKKSSRKQRAAPAPSSPENEQDRDHLWSDRLVPDQTLSGADVPQPHPPAHGAADAIQHANHSEYGALPRARMPSASPALAGMSGGRRATIRSEGRTHLPPQEPLTPPTQQQENETRRAAVKQIAIDLGDLTEELKLVRDRRRGQARSPSPQNESSCCNEESVEARIEDDTCVVCMDGAKTHAFVPCGHLCVCHACSKSLSAQGARACPICREPSSLVIPVFRS